MSNKKILKNIRDNIEKYWIENNDLTFDEINPRINLHEPTFGPDEVMALVEVMLSTNVTMGRKVLQFEDDLSKYFNISETVTNNSGSSANLLAISALANIQTENNLKPGDEVIVPALSWSTTIWPLIQNNLVPVFVDIDPLTLNIDPNKIEDAISEKTSAIMIVPVYGNPCEMDAITSICQKYKLTLIEDTCESLGASYDGKPLGTFGRVGTYSFYFSHHMTTLEGGVCITNDFDLAEMMRILRAHGWIREMKKPNKYIDLVSDKDIDPRFLFVNLGYNLRLTEPQGAMGIIQLPKLDDFVNSRRQSANFLLENLEKYGSVLSFQKETNKGRHSWFGFPLVIKDDATFSVADLRSHLEKSGIETRPIISGDMTQQPAFNLYEHKTSGSLDFSKNIMKNGLAIACHQSLDSKSLQYISNSFDDFMRQKGIS